MPKTAGKFQTSAPSAKKNFFPFLRFIPFVLSALELPAEKLTLNQKAGVKRAVAARLPSVLARMESPLKKATVGEISIWN